MKLKYISHIDSVLAVCLYLEVRRHSSRVLSKLHQDYGGSCVFKAFKERVFRTIIYARPNSQALKNTTVSIQISDTID